MENDFQSVINEFGEEVVVNTAKKKLISYSNKNRKVVYSAPIVEDGVEKDFWTNYETTGTVDDVAERLRMPMNAVLMAYAKTVDYNASENDPDRKIWNTLVEMIKEKPDYCFDENGDFLENFVLDPVAIVKAASEMLD